ncbi:MAG: YaaR family protein [Clostridiaceae bacterium]|nr:YaaR family protein [Clostridiaceae bacterium]
MKITEIKNHPSSITGTIAKEDKRTDITSSRSSFGDTLIKTEEHDLTSRLNRLMSDIEKQGENLGKSMDIKELKNYKKLISEFMNEVVNNSLKFSKQSHFDRRGRHKVYALVRKVNAKIEELSRDFLKEEKDNIKILESIGNIKGMLFDMYM